MIPPSGNAPAPGRSIAHFVYVRGELFYLPDPLHSQRMALGSAPAVDCPSVSSCSMQDYGHPLGLCDIRT